MGCGGRITLGHGVCRYPMLDALKQWIARHPARVGALAGWYHQACGLVGAMIAVPLIIRLLPQEQAGLWFTFLSMVAVLQLTDFGFTLLLSRQVAYSMTTQGGEGHGGADFLDLRSGWAGVIDVYALTRATFRWLTGIGLITLAVLYHAVLPLGKLLEHRNLETMISWYAMGIAALLLVQVKPHQALLDGMARVYLTRMLAGTQLLLNGFGVVCVLLMGGRLVHMALAVLLIAILNYAVVRVWVRRIIAPHVVVPVSLPRKTLVQFFRVAAPLGLLSFSAFLVLSVQVPLIGFLLGPAVVPAYFLAQRIGTVLNQACLQFMYPQLPLFTQQVGARRYSEAASRMRRSLAIVGWGTLAVNLVFYLASPTLVDAWVGPGRYLAGFPLLILAVDFGIMNFAGAWGAFVLARGLNPFVVSTLLAGLINLLLCVVLGQRFGLAGVAMASLLAGVCTNYWFVPMHGVRMMAALKEPRLSVA